MPFEQRCSDIVFQFLQPLGQRRLGAMSLTGGIAEAASLDQAFQQLKVAQA
ncbi:hypothetical protein D9M71_165930 [compost metagenome]